MQHRTVMNQQVLTFLKFAAIGVLTASLYALLLFLAVEVAMLHPAFGAAIAYLMAVCFNYWAHYSWTYNSNQSHRSTGTRYLVVIASIFSINVAATAFLPVWLGVSYWFAQLLLGMLMIAMTFISLSVWVFSPSTSTASVDENPPGPPPA